MAFRKNQKVKWTEKREPDEPQDAPGVDPADVGDLELPKPQSFKQSGTIVEVIKEKLPGGDRTLLLIQPDNTPEGFLTQVEADAAQAA